MTVPFETSPAVGSLPAIKHGFFGRLGGVSTGLYRGLNVGLGSADNIDDVRENRRRVIGALDAGASHLSGLHQIHSPTCITVSQPVPEDNRPEADALVTNQPHIALSVLTADCCPVLFADADAHVIGAAHAGWRGAAHGILENTIASMEALGADRDRIIAAIGPTISAEQYEVGEDFKAEVLQADRFAVSYFRERRDWPKPHFDLPGYVEQRLRNARIGTLTRVSPGCTYTDPNRYFSYRRACHAGESDYGRQVATICMSQ